mmetsp:Transcript_15229/g.27975  ORF Transcript_15229/g.27975 Transcript_15229/m.27975 type:complete len:93 (-) Transcript_15229:850-1128(-)
MSPAHAAKVALLSVTRCKHWLSQHGSNGSDSNDPVSGEIRRWRRLHPVQDVHKEVGPAMAITIKVISARVLLGDFVNISSTSASVVDAKLKT